MKENNYLETRENMRRIVGGREICIAACMLILGMALVCVLLFETIFISSCTKQKGDSSKKEAIVQHDNSVLDQAARTSIIGAVDSNKEVYSLNDTIILRFKTPHPRQLAIVSPDNDFYFIASDKLVPEIEPIMSSEYFQSIDFYVIEIETFSASVYDASDFAKRKVFDKPGKYRIIIGDNLETENDDIAEKVVMVK